MIFGPVAYRELIDRDSCLIKNVFLAALRFDTAEPGV